MRPRVQRAAPHRTAATKGKGVEWTKWTLVSAAAGSAHPEAACGILGQPSASPRRPAAALIANSAP